MAGVARIGVDPRRCNARQNLAQGPDEPRNKAQLRGVFPRAIDRDSKRIDSHPYRTENRDEINEPPPPDIIPNYFLLVAPAFRVSGAFELSLRHNSYIGQYLVRLRNTNRRIAVCPD